MKDKIDGVFFQEKEAIIGTGHTEKTVKQKMYCQAKQINDNEIEIHYLGADDKPLSVTEKIPKNEFLHKFTFHPYYLEKKKAEKDRKTEKLIATAEDHANRNELHSAEFEFKNALKLDMENLRANFGIGNVYLKMGEKSKASEIFTKISKIDALFDEKNKHFFNECGIQLRKQELFDEAINYYEKAMKTSPNDENLCFNLARAQFEKGDVENAKETIYKAISINPNYKEGKAFLDYMSKNKE